MSTETATEKFAIYDELAALVAASLVRDGLATPEVARQAADRFIDRLRRSHLAGIKHYLPKGKAIDVERVRREIGARWTGRNTHDLCAEFDISETWLRELHAQATGRMRATG